MFFNTNGRFAQVFQPKPLKRMQDKSDQSAQKILDDNEIFTLDARETDSVIVKRGGNIGLSSTYMAMDLTDVRERIQEYYRLAQMPEVDEAIDIIVNEIVSVEDDNDVIDLDLSKLELSEPLKEKIRDRWEHVQSVMKYNSDAYTLVKDWYVSGRQGFFITINPKRPKDGVNGAILLDSRCLRPITAVELDKDRNSRTEINRVIGKDRGFLYDPSIVERTRKDGTQLSYSYTAQTIFIPEYSVAYQDSGEKSDVYGFVPSKLSYAIKAINNLDTVEDATVIYAITRAPERRAFFLDTGTMSANSAEAFMDDMMERFQTELHYDRTSGRVMNDQSTMGIVEDFWLPRREGANATDIQSLDGGQNLGEMRHVLYFQKKVYKALKIPEGRIEEGGMVNIGGSDLGEVDRKEHIFNKYARRLGRRYLDIPKDVLLRDLLLTGIFSQDDVEKYRDQITLQFNSDSYVVERQQAETMSGRIQNLQQIQPYVGKIISLETALKQCMRMTDEEIAEERDKINKELKDKLYGGMVSPLEYDQNQGQDSMGDAGIDDMGGFDDPDQTTPPEEPEPTDTGDDE